METRTNSGNNAVEKKLSVETQDGIYFSLVIDNIPIMQIGVPVSGSMDGDSLIKDGHSIITDLVRRASEVFYKREINALATELAKLKEKKDGDT